MRVTYESKSSNATCTTGLAPTWIQGKLAVRGEHHVKDWPWPGVRALTSGVAMMSHYMKMSMP